MKIGDRAWDLMTRRYGTITKKFKMSVRFEPENRPGGYQIGPMTVPAGRLQWKEYSEVKPTI